jgi:hypothetical protein
VPSPSIDPIVPVRAPEAEIVPTRRFVRVFDAPAEAASAVPSHHASEPSVAERLLGAEQLTVLRARYAEILARISARGGDPARLEALREQAASVNPDVWVTEADVAAGLSTVDATLSDLHRIVGRRRRRRRRRNDGRRGVAPASSEATIPAESGGPARDLEFAGDSDDDDEGPDDEGPAEG